jgi:hypothetical protein
MSDKVTPIKDMWSLIAPIVDVQPAWNLAVFVKTPGYSGEAQDFARFKLREAIRQMRDAANALEKELGGPEKKSRAK